jgi:hypothetical protein
MSWDENAMLEDVKFALERFPGGIRHLFDNRKQKVDLTRVFRKHGEAETTLEFLATRIHAGYGDDLRYTSIFFPPPVENYLKFHFLKRTRKVSKILKP